MENPISKFCELKGLPINIERAFTSYIKSMYSTRYQMHPDGDTVKTFVLNMSEQQIQEAWQNFVSDLASVTPRVLPTL